MREPIVYRSASLLRAFHDRIGDLENERIRNGLFTFFSSDPRPAFSNILKAQLTRDKSSVVRNYATRIEERLRQYETLTEDDLKDLLEAYLFNVVLYLKLLSACKTIIAFVGKFHVQELSFMLNSDNSVSKLEYVSPAVRFPETTSRAPMYQKHVSITQEDYPTGTSKTPHTLVGPVSYVRAHNTQTNQKIILLGDEHIGGGVSTHLKDEEDTITSNEFLDLWIPHAELVLESGSSEMRKVVPLDTQTSFLEQLNRVSGLQLAIEWAVSKSVGVSWVDFRRRKSEDEEMRR